MSFGNCPSSNTRDFCLDPENQDFCLVFSNMIYVHSFPPSESISLLELAIVLNFLKFGCLMMVDSNILALCSFIKLAIIRHETLVHKNIYTQNITNRALRMHNPSQVGDAENTPKLLDMPSHQNHED